MANLASILCGCLVLVVWYFDIDVINSGYSLITRVLIRTNSVFCFTLAAISLWLLQLGALPKTNKGRKKRHSSPLGKFYLKFYLNFYQWLHFYARVLAKVAVGLVIFISSLTLIDEIGYWRLGMGELIFIDISPVSGISYPGKMGIFTAINFIFVGIAMILLSRKRGSRYDGYGQVCCFLSAITSLLMIIGYGDKKAEIINQITPNLSSIGLYEALIFLVFCLGMLWMSGDRGLVGMAIKKSSMNYWLWRWLLLGLSIPITMGWLIIQGQRLNYYDPGFAIGLFVVVAIAFFVVLIWEFALAIANIQQQRDCTREMLQISQNKLQTVLDTNILGIVCGDIHGGIQQANDQFLQMSGYSREELLASRINWLEVLSINHIPQDGQHLSQPCERELLCKDGSRMSVLCSYGFLSATQTDTITYVLDLSDRQQLKIANQQDQRQLKLLKELTQNITDCSHPRTIIETWFAKLAPELGLDAYWNYLVENNSPVMHLESYGGISPALAESMEYIEIVTQNPSTIVLKDVQSSTDPKIKFIRNAGIQAYYRRVLRVQGKLLGTIAFASRQRSQFSENEQAIMQTVADQIAIAIERWVLTNCLQQQAEQLRDINRIRDEFLSILSHELRSPLQSILGWAQLLRSRNLSTNHVTKGLDAIERNAKTQTQIVEDLLDISRMIKGKLTLNVRNCDLLPILQTVLENIKLATAVKEIDFSYFLNGQCEETGEQGTRVVPEDSREYQHHSSNSSLSTLTHSQFVVSGDPERLQQIIWNLLSNAIKFTPHGGRVEIFLSQVEDTNLSDSTPLTTYAQIQIKDTGVGIDSDLIPYIFDRFYQTDSSNTRLHGGMGLGLAIVRHLVELHGGIIDVSSPGIGQGTVFTVKLPLLNTQPQPISTAPEKTIFPGSDRQSFYHSPKGSINLSADLLQGVRVLIVDQQGESQDFLVAVLQSYQAETQAVSSVAEAINAIQECKPDVLVCNMEMPQEDGYSLIRQLRSLESVEQARKIPAAALTADARAEQRMRAIHEGYQMYLFKPVEPCELITVVACLAGRI